MLFDVATQRHELVGVLVDRGDDHAGEGGGPAHQLATGGERLREDVLEELHTGRRVRSDDRGEAECRGSGEVRGVVEDLRAVRVPLAVQGVLVQRHQAGRDGLLVEPVADVGPSDRAERQEARRPEVGVHASREPLNALTDQDIE